jgi:hypothetical protein
MGQQQAQIRNNMIPDKLSLEHPQMTKKKKRNLHTVATRRPLALNSRSKEFKQNLEDPVETEFSDHFARPMTSKNCSLSFQIQSHERGQYKRNHIII